MCKVPSHVAHQRGTSRKQVRSDGGLGVVGARGRPGAEGEQEAEVEGEQEVEAEGGMGGVPLTNGLCSSITELKHIKAVKEPWCQSSQYKALIKMLWILV